MRKIKKAVFPVAGLGTRFLPATKANPKEMLPVVDKPLIQYAVEEAIGAGATQLIFVTSSAKRSIEDHFDSNHELEARLEELNKHELLDSVRKIKPDNVSCVYVRQTEQKGLGHAVLCAKEVVGNEPFAVLLADDLIYGLHGTCLQQMVSVYNKSPGNVVAVEKIEPHQTESYGIVKTALGENRVGEFTEIVEKPKPDDAPSNLAVAGRYILEPEIFTALEAAKPGSGGEIQLTDAIAALIGKVPSYALEFMGQRYDCGSKLGYLKATIAYGCRHKTVGEEFSHYLNSLPRIDRDEVNEQTALSLVAEN